jgi:hypothetical protein
MQMSELSNTETVHLIALTYVSHTIVSGRPQAMALAGQYILWSYFYMVQIYILGMKEISITLHLNPITNYYFGTVSF